MSTFCSMVKLCINRDNLLVPLILAANQISVYQMRKCFKLFILAQFLSVRVLASKQLFIHPCLSLSSPCSPLFLLHSSPFLLSLPLISPPIIATSLLPSSPLSYSVPPPLLSLSLLLPPFSCFLNYPLSSLLLTSIFTHHFLPSCQGSLKVVISVYPYLQNTPNFSRCYKKLGPFYKKLKCDKFGN